jgi:hypothetical protein
MCGSLIKHFISMLDTGFNPLLHTGRGRLAAKAITGNKSPP